MDAICVVLLYAALRVGGGPPRVIRLSYGLFIFLNTALFFKYSHLVLTIFKYAVVLRFFMGTFDEYFNIKEFPPGFLDDVKRLNEVFQGKYPEWEAQIDIVHDEWPQGNLIRLNYGKLTLVQLSEIDNALHALFQKYDITYELYSSGFTHGDEG
jgi:hypothetical protein